LLTVLRVLGHAVKWSCGLLARPVPKRTTVPAGKPPQFISTNHRIFYAIARQAFETMTELDAKLIRPRSDGQPGYVKTLDPEQRSFKDAFICIVFCGVYLDALLHLRISRKLGIEKSKELDRKTYEVKLKKLGFRDKAILSDVRKFRLARNEVVHEKAFLNADDLKVAQDEATFAFDLVERIRASFGIQVTGNYRSLWESTEAST
jgi:hypothetical protein